MHDEILSPCIKSRLAEYEASLKRIRSGKFSPSSFGRCYRYQIWNRKNEPVSNPLDVKVLIKFEQGTATHRMIQRDYPPEALEKKIEIEDVKGYSDIVLSAAYDIKSTEQWSYKRFWLRPLKFLEADQYGAFLQVCWYALELGLKEAVILPTPFGMYPTVECRVQAEDWRDDVECELYHLRMYWDLGDAPAEPRAYGGRECTYCSFHDKCKGEE